MKVLITCPPMLQARTDFESAMVARGLQPVCPNVTQTLTEDELIDLLPTVDGWIIGDDPVTYRVLEAGVRGRLRAAVKWGAGTDNVDFEACEKLGLPIANTPGMFGDEVADLAMHYVIGLARETFFIDRAVRAGGWPKPVGLSLRGRRLGVVGLGDIGQQLVIRAKAFGLEVVAYDPYATANPAIQRQSWPDQIEKLDFLVFTCALTSSTRGMLDHKVIEMCKPGVRVVNVARGELIDESALIKGLGVGRIESVALDVFASEPPQVSNALFNHSKCVFGSHNASNTVDAVRRTNQKALSLLTSFLGIGV